MIVAKAVAVQPLLSVTVTVYAPATRLFIVAVVALFDQRYVYAIVPPEAVTVALPLLPPLQLTFD